MRRRKEVRIPKPNLVKMFFLLEDKIWSGNKSLLFFLIQMQNLEKKLKNLTKMVNYGFSSIYNRRRDRTLLKERESFFDLRLNSSLGINH